MKNNLYIILIIILSLIFIEYGHITGNNKFCDKTVLKINSITIDIWAVAHFVSYFIFGILKPNKTGFFFIMGLIYEIFEDLIASDNNTILMDCKTKNKTGLKKIHCNGFSDSYWYAKFEDPIINLLGYVLGQWVNNTFLQKK